MNWQLPNETCLQIEWLVGKLHFNLQLNSVRLRVGDSYSSITSASNKILVWLSYGEFGSLFIQYSYNVAMQN